MFRDKIDGTWVGQNIAMFWSSAEQTESVVQVINIHPSLISGFESKSSDKNLTHVEGI